MKNWRGCYWRWVVLFICAWSEGKGGSQQHETRIHTAERDWRKVMAAWREKSSPCPNASRHLCRRSRFGPNLQDEMRAHKSSFVIAQNWICVDTKSDFCLQKSPKNKHNHLENGRPTVRSNNFVRAKAAFFHTRIARRFNFRLNSATANYEKLTMPAENNSSLPEAAAATLTT